MHNPALQSQSAHNTSPGPSGSVHPGILAGCFGTALAFFACMALAGDFAAGLAVQSIALMGIGFVFTALEWISHRRLTLAATFVAIYGFIYGARALYIFAVEDFDIFAKPFAINPSWGEMNRAMAMIGVSITFFVFGTMIGNKRVAVANTQQWNGWKERLRKRPSVSSGQQIMMLILQAGLVTLLVPIAMRDYKVALTDQYASAYVYLLPTLLHGVNLFVVTVLLISLFIERSFSWMATMVSAFIALGLMFLNAYLLANLSTFRGFWMAGFLLISVATLYVIRGRVNPAFLLILFIIYPFFKQLGVDRSLSSMETIELMVSNPTQAYTKEGIQTAYGAGTDLNMFDTFVASSLWDHEKRPYALPVFYTFVHWIPRQWWSDKPEGGNLADSNYTNGAPYSPGIVGFFYDDGGLLYMFFAMFVLGVLVRYLDWRVVLIHDQLLQGCVYACLFFGTVVLTRSFLYQTFYGVLAFLLPLLLTHRLLWGKKGLTVASPLRFFKRPR